MKESTLSTIILTILFVPLVLLHSWIFCTLWKWFIVPTFGLSEISIAAAIGIFLIIDILKGISIKTEDDNTLLETITFIVKNIIYPLFYILIGFIVKFFI